MIRRERLREARIDPDRAETVRLALRRRLDLALDAVRTHDEVFELARVQHGLEPAVGKRLDATSGGRHEILHRHQTEKGGEDVEEAEMVFPLHRRWHRNPPGAGRAP